MYFEFEPSAPATKGDLPLPSPMLLRQNTGGIAPLDPPATAGAVLRFYRFPGLASSACDTLLRRLAATVKPVSPVALDTEFCYYRWVRQGTRATRDPWTPKRFPPAADRG